MKKNSSKRILSFCMAALVIALSIVPYTTNGEGNYEVAPCENVKPDPNPSDSPITI